MKILFFSTSIFVFMLLEFFIGTAGIYLPFCWMSFFYFSAAEYPRKVIIPGAFIAALLMDLILYRRIFLPDVVLCGFVIYMTLRYRGFWRVSIWHGGFAGLVIIITGYFIQYACSYIYYRYPLRELLQPAAMMVFLLPFGYMLEAGIIFVLEKLQKKLRLEVPFISVRNDSVLNICRKNYVRGR